MQQYYFSFHTFLLFKTDHDEFEQLNNSLYNSINEDAEHSYIRGDNNVHTLLVSEIITSV